MIAQMHLLCFEINVTYEEEVNYVIEIFTIFRSMTCLIRLQAFFTCKVRRKTEDNVRVRNISAPVRPASVRVLYGTYRVLNMKP